MPQVGFSSFQFALFATRLRSLHENQVKKVPLSVGLSVRQHALTFLNLFIQFILLLSHAGNDLAQCQRKRTWERFVI